MSRSNYQFKENTFESVVPASLQYSQSDSTIIQQESDSQDLIRRFEDNFGALEKEILRCVPHFVSQMIHDVSAKIAELRQLFARQSKEKTELMMYVRSQVRTYTQQTHTIIEQNQHLRRQKEEMEYRITKMTSHIEELERRSEAQVELCEEQSQIRHVIDLVLERVMHQCELRGLTREHQKALSAMQLKCVEQESDEKACKGGSSFFEKGKTRFGGVSTATGSQFLQSQSFHQRFMQINNQHSESNHYSESSILKGRGGSIYMDGQNLFQNESQLSILADTNLESNGKTKFALKSLSFAPNFEEKGFRIDPSRSTSTPQRMDQFSINEMQTQFKLLRRQKESVKRSINQWQGEFLSKEGRPPTPKDKDSIGSYFQKYATLQAQADRLEQEIKGRQSRTQEVAVQVEFSKVDIQEREAKLSQLNGELKRKQQHNLEVSQKLRESLSANKSLTHQMMQNNIIMTQLSDQVDQQQVCLQQKNREVRQLSNQVEDFKGKVRVFCRLRPIDKNQQCIIEVSDPMSLTLMHGNLKKSYKFDSCYDGESTQADIFEDVRPLIQQAYEGFNVCIFAYGQTGSGKTYTMHGTADEPGMVPRLAEELFSLIQDGQHTNQCSVYCYITELYKDQIVDLLGAKTQLEVREDVRGFTYIQNVTTVQIVSKIDLLESIAYAVSHRRTSNTEMNEQSSRSHLIVTICLENYCITNNKKTVTKICLIDLAGSERINRSNPTPLQLQEGKSINKSLTALGDVISALIASQEHIPYRNSKLTHLMKDCLGGNSKTIMMINMSPAECNIEETQMALMYGQRVKNIKNNPVKNHETNEMSKIKEICKKLQEENDALKQEEVNKRQICLPLQQSNKRI